MVRPLGISTMFWPLQDQCLIHAAPTIGIIAFIFLQKVVFFLQTPNFFFLSLHLLAELNEFLVKLIALCSVCEPVPRSRLPRRLALIQPYMVFLGTPSSLAALAGPISLASFTACTLYSWSYYLFFAIFVHSSFSGLYLKSLRIGCQLK